MSAECSSSMIPWRGAVTYGRELTFGYGFMFLVAAALWTTRAVTKRKGADERMTLLLFDSAMRLVFDFASFLLQAILLAELFSDLHDERICPFEVDLYVISIMLLATGYMAQVLIRPDIDFIIFAHHTTTIVCFVLLISRSGDGESFSPILAQSAWKQLMALGTILGLFGSSEFYLHAGMICYRTQKERRPVLVYRVMWLVLFLQCTSRIAVHILFFYTYAVVYPQVPFEERTLLILLPAFAIVLMGLEYYDSYIIFNIIKNHKHKRMTRLPEKSKDGTDHIFVETDHQVKISGKAPERGNDGNA